MKYFYLFLFSFSLVFSAERTENEILNNNNLQSYLNVPSNVGKDFWITIPPAYLESVTEKTYVRVIVGAAKEANVRLYQKGKIDKSIVVPGGSTNSFELKPGEGQPYIRNVSDLASTPAKIWEDFALNVISDEPVVVYVVVRYAYTSDGYLAIPVDGLGKKYIATNYDAREWAQGYSLPNMLCLVSPYDNTNVKFTLGSGSMAPARVEIEGGRILTTGEYAEFNMKKGDVIVISNVGADETLSGSLIESDKDIAVFSANYCADIPLRVRACDYIVEQDLPMETWGQAYGVPSFNYRTKPGIIRVFAKEANTTVYRNGSEIIYLEKGLESNGGLQNEAWIEARVWPVGTENKPAIYTADKPIYISFYNPSSQDDGKPSDPFSLIITPVEQYLNEILFSTPSANGGLDFKEHFINIFFEADENGFVPEDFMFTQVIDGVENWKSVREVFGASADDVYRLGATQDGITNGDLVGKRLAHKQIKLPGDGIYKLKSPTRFAGFSTGYDDFDTYGFPTAGMFKFNTEDLTPPMVRRVVIDCDGNVSGEAIDFGNNDAVAGLTTPKIDFSQSENFSNVSISTENFRPGQEKIDFKMNVIDSEKPATATIYFSDRSGNYTSEVLEFVPSGISIPKPEITYSGNLLLCDEDSSIELTVENKGYSRVEWSNGETSESIVVNQGGRYYVKAFDDNDCFLLSEEINVTSIDNVKLEITKSTSNPISCEGDEVELTAFVYYDGDVVWSNGVQSNSIKVTETGDYSYKLKLNDIDCEFNSEVVRIEFTPIPEKPEIIYDNYTLKVETNAVKINWYIDGVISNEHKDKKVIAPDKDGNYSVEVFEETGTCSNSSDEYNVTWMSVLENIAEEKITISPNPSNGNFTLNIDTELIGEVEFNVLDINGKKVFTQKALINSTNYATNFKLNELSKGVYILNIKSNAREINKKIIVE
jgi:hypothetical protein